MITLFVVQSCADKKDIQEAVESFGELASEVHHVPSLAEINGTDRGDWYGVIYDDECIDDRLKEALKVFIAQTDADVLILFKRKEERVFHSPRVFRHHITLRDGSLMPEQTDTRFETVLNGWVDDNGRSQ